ncbi:MAG: imidazole glycerol phosphate synthase subunit HisH [Cyclobacteriaceae bacterium]|jgi:imidazole glycerol-phosphate synthase subunit HisH|nr:imidazole glycerol phosphate synthase subunit HisH [Cyclobacteriaceae bacterium]
MSKVVIIDYGAGNVQSVKFALNRLDIIPVLSKDHDTIMSADKVIFPGVGEARSAMKAINAVGLKDLIPGLKQPVLGVCLGMQLLCEHSVERNTDGIGVFPLTVKKMIGDIKVPHMGWNQITDLKSPLFDGLSEGEYMYFVHGYFVPDSEYTIATTDYGIPYASAIQKDNFFGCQFHPEKSSDAGQRILKNFLEL